VQPDWSNLLYREDGGLLDGLRHSVGEGGLFQLLSLRDFCTLLKFVVVDDILKLRDTEMSKIGVIVLRVLSLRRGW